MAQQSELNLRALTDRLREKARRKVPEADVEDLVQDVLVVLVEKAQSNQIGAIQPYAEGILRHMVYDYYQKRAENQVPLDGKDAESQDVSPEQRVFWQRHLRVVREVSQENPVDQALLQEHFLSGSPLREVATDLGVSAGVVNGRLFRFRQKLLQRVGHIFTVLMALGIGLWSRVSRALFVGRMQHATSWTLALLSVGSMGTWWTQHLPEKKLTTQRTFLLPADRASQAGWEESFEQPTPAKKKSTQTVVSVTSQKKMRLPVFFSGTASPSLQGWGWLWGGRSRAAASPASSAVQHASLAAGTAPLLGRGVWFANSLGTTPTLERGNTIFAGAGYVDGGRSDLSGSNGTSNGTKTRDRGTPSSEPTHKNEPTPPTKVDEPPQKPEQPKQPTEPKQPTTSSPQSFCIKRDGRLYRCDEKGNLGEDVSGSNQSSFGCGEHTSCRRMVNGEKDGEVGSGPALVIGQKNTLAVVGENRYRESNDQGNSWSEPTQPPEAEAVLLLAVFILNQRGEIWQRDLAKGKWSLLRATQENASEIRVHLDQRGGLCFEDTFDFRFETRIPGIDPVASTKTGGLLQDVGLKLPKLPDLKPAHAPGFNKTDIAKPAGDFPQGMPLPLPAPHQQTQLPPLPR